MEENLLEDSNIGHRNLERWGEKYRMDSFDATHYDIFSGLLQTNRLFIRREVLMPTHIPKVLPHREREMKSLATILTPALRGETPSNTIIHGKPGTGKTVVARSVGRQLVDRGEKSGRHVNFICLNCSRVDTQYRILQNMANHFAKDGMEHIPFTGLPSDVIYTRLCSLMDEAKGVTVVVLDEIDKLKGDDALYTLSRMNENLENAKMSIIGISNNLNFTEFLDSRVKSSLGEEPLVFPPYDAEQLQDILRQRAEASLKPDAIDEDVIPLCSALSAQEHGDARKAIDLLRASVELAERDGASKVTVSHVRTARNKIEFDRTTDAVRGLPSQSKLLLYAILLMEKENKKAGIAKGVTTGEVYEVYKVLCGKTRIEHLTQRRIADLISELDALGIITGRVISKGRQGRTREIKVSYSYTGLIQVLREDEMLKELADYRIKNQMRLY